MGNAGMAYRILSTWNRTRTRTSQAPGRDKGVDLKEKRRGKTLRPAPEPRFLVIDEESHLLHDYFIFIKQKCPGKNRREQKNQHASPEDISRAGRNPVSHPNQ
jgi:hypothetical protein